MKLAIHKFSRFKNPLRIEEVKAVYRLIFVCIFPLLFFFHDKKNKINNFTSDDHRIADI